MNKEKPHKQMESMTGGPPFLEWKGDGFCRMDYWHIRLNRGGFCNRPATCGQVCGLHDGRHGRIRVGTP